MTTASMSPVILLAHGSPDPRSQAAAQELARSATQTLGREIEIAFLDHNAPDLSAACRCAVLRGHVEAIVVPLFLSRAFHARVDVPREIEQASAATGMHLRTTRALGCDGTFLDAAVRGLPETAPVVFATAGTSDVSAQADLRAQVDTFIRRTGRDAELAFASQSQPDPATAIAALEARTGMRAAVASLVLFPGVLPDRIAAAAGDRPLGGPIGASPEVVSGIALAIAEVVVPAGAAP